MRIAEALTDGTKLLLQISFLTKIALVFTGFLNKFQEEESLIHILYPKLQIMLSTLILRFLKTSCQKVGKALLDIDVTDEGKHLSLESRHH